MGLKNINSSNMMVSRIMKALNCIDKVTKIIA